MEELFQRLNAAQIRYLLIGGQAIRLAGMPRYSMDWNVFIPGRDFENLRKLNKTLEDELEGPVEPLGPAGQGFVQTYQTQHGIIQFHLGVPGLCSFDDAESRLVLRSTERGMPVRCVSDEDLLRAKQAAGRPQDQLDVAFLTAKLAAQQTRKTGV